MKTFWVKGPTPFKSERSINARIYINVQHMQEHVQRPLKRNEIVSIIRKMKEKGILTSKRDSSGLFNAFRASMRTQGLLSEEKTEATTEEPEKSE